MTYRNPVPAMRGQLAALQRALRETSELRERAALLARIDEVELRLEAETQKRSLPLLTSARIAAPCPASWDAMVGDDRVRHCGICDRGVYDLSAMEGREAEQLLRLHGEQLCARIFRRADGMVMTSDCLPGVRRRRRRRLAVLGAATLVAAQQAISSALPSAQAPEWKSPLAAASHAPIGRPFDRALFLDSEARAQSADDQVDAMLIMGTGGGGAVSFRPAVESAESVLRRASGTHGPARPEDRTSEPEPVPQP